MKNHKIEAYEFYKVQYPAQILFFLVGENYEAYGSDVLEVSKALEVKPEDSIIKIPANDILDVVGRLYLKDIPSRTIISVNDMHKYDVPDVARIKKEMEEDY